MERVFSVRSFCSSRSRTTYRLRRRGTRRKGTAGYPWSVSVSRAVQRGSGGARSSASETKIRREKNHATLASSPRRRRFRVCVTKEGLSAPDRSSEKSANAFLMSGDTRRREERTESRLAKKRKTKPPPEKRTPTVEARPAAGRAPRAAGVS